MPIVFYYLPSCGPSRAVLMTAEHLGIKLERKHVHLSKGEHMTPEFLKMNPQHSVPTIDDNGFYLWESRAIQTYLVNKYAPDSPLYPKDPKERAAVDRMLYYDVGNLSKDIFDYMYPQVAGNQPADPEKDEAIKKSLAIFEKILEKTPYAAGNHITLADYSIIGNMLFIQEVLGYSFADFSKVSAWLEKMKRETPKYKEINEIPLRKFKENLKLMK